VVAQLLAVPAGADAELEAPARQVVDARDLLGGDDRVALGDQADAAADPPAGYGVSRLAGMCVCSAKNSDSWPRSSSIRAIGPGPMPSCVGK
jgi:hypothetical protein